MEVLLGSHALSGDFVAFPLSLVPELHGLGTFPANTTDPDSNRQQEPGHQGFPPAPAPEAFDRSGRTRVDRFPRTPAVQVIPHGRSRLITPAWLFGHRFETN